MDDAAGVVVTKITSRKSRMKIVLRVEIETIGYEEVEEAFLD